MVVAFVVEAEVEFGMRAELAVEEFVNERL